MHIGGEPGRHADSMQHCEGDDRHDHPVILAHESWSQRQRCLGEAQASKKE
jgi:hypothetical protein